MFKNSLAEDFDMFAQPAPGDGGYVAGGSRFGEVPAHRPQCRTAQFKTAGRNQGPVPEKGGREKRPRRGAATFSQESLTDEPETLHKLDVVAASRRRKSLREEMPSALRAYDRAVIYMRRVTVFAYQGALHVDGIEDVAAGIIASLRNNRDALIALPRIVQRDSYLYTHAVNVAIMMASYYLCAGRSEDDVMKAVVAGLLFDLGKTLLPQSLLNSKQRLSETERYLVRRHLILGHGLLAEMFQNVPPEVLLAALEHHERHDGSGYPRRISGDAISRIGKLTAIADCYDALSSRRAYQDALFPAQALSVMYRMRDSKFDPVLLTLFVRMLGIYPVGTIIQLQDGYRGLVVGSNLSNPLKPTVALVMDANGLPMPHLECDLAKERVGSICRCLKPEEAGIDPHQILGYFTSMRARVN